MSGFIKGVRVFTQEGKQPIETLKPGDMVLSKPEDDSGPIEYVRVINVIQQEPQPIYHISINPAGWKFPAPTHALIAAWNQRIWVAGKGWVDVENLKREQAILQGNGELAEFGGKNSIYRTGKAGIGWTPSTKSLNNRGTVFDYANYQLASAEDQKQFVYLPDEVLKSDDHLLRVAVFTLKLERFHTFFVGGQFGYWAHS